jgi:hypothetical protein
MLWREISDDLTTWTMPGERTKNGVAHVVPLVGAPFGDWSQAKRALDEAITHARTQTAAASGTTAAPLVPWTLHDLRRTVATGLQRLGVCLEVTGGVLNHISGSRGGIAGVYQRHDWADEKRTALDAWATHVLAIAEQLTHTPRCTTRPRFGQRSSSAD